MRALTLFTVVRLGEAALIWADRPLREVAATQLHSALETLITDGVAPLVVDLIRVPAVDEPVVAVLAAAATRAGEAGRCLDLRLTGNRRFAVRDAAQLRYAIAMAYPNAA